MAGTGLHSAGHDDRAALIVGQAILPRPGINVRSRPIFGHSRQSHSTPVGRTTAVFDLEIQGIYHFKEIVHEASPDADAVGGGERPELLGRMPRQRVADRGILASRTEERPS